MGIETGIRMANTSNFALHATGSTASREPVAHTPQGNAGDWHYLNDHLESVAKLAREFCNHFDAGPIGALVGYLHDFGKHSPAFQDYLLACHRAALTDGTPPPRGSAPHSKYGAAVAHKLYRRGHPPDVIVGKGAGAELAWVILNHHGSLSSLSKLDTKLAEVAVDTDIRNLIETHHSWLLELFTREGFMNLPDFQAPRQRALFIRMLLSALVDADRLDTGWHFGNRVVALQPNNPKETIVDLLGKLKEAQSRLRSDETVLSRARNTFFDTALDRAKTKPGLFRMTIPTGGGKTLSSLAFALEHARQYGLRRVVIALPLTSITQQTAAVYRDILGEENVLEHHTNMRFKASTALLEQQYKRATENWDAPIIVTTTVQLFESLFSNHTSKVRKIHNLTKSVIVIDEAQTLSGPFIEPIIDSLDEITKPRYGSSVVLCTATQPALTPLFRKLKISRDFTELAADPPRYFRELARVRYETHIKTLWSWQKVTTEMMSSPKALCIVNTKSQARALYETLIRQDSDAQHLSTNMVPVHRLKVIQDIRKRKHVRVVSTQLIEAGVDLDFLMVMRALGPLDSIVQAAGRCNREAGDEYGRVLIFAPEDDPLPPGSYRTARDITKDLLKYRTLDFNNPKTFEAYFQSLYGGINTDANNILVLSDELDFPEVAEKFKMIKEGSEGAIVPQYDPSAVKSILRQGLNKQTQRALQPYTVNFLTDEIDKFLANGLLEHNDLDLLEWTGSYDDRLGIIKPE